MHHCGLSQLAVGHTSGARRDKQLVRDQQTAARQCVGWQERKVVHVHSKVDAAVLVAQVQAHLAQRVASASLWDPKAGWPSPEQRGLALHPGGVLAALNCAAGSSPELRTAGSRSTSTPWNSTVSSPSAGSGTRASRRPTTASRRRSNSSSDSSSSDSDNGSGTGSGAALPPAGRQRSPRRVTRARRGRGTATTPTAGLELRLPSSSGSDDEAFGVPSSRSSSNRVTPRRGNNRHAESGGHGGRNSLHSTLSSHSLPPGAVNVDDVVAPVNTERATDTGLVAATAELTANPLASQSGRRSGRRSRRRLVAERRHT